MKAAVIGAGISGIVAARQLSQSGCQVDVFEKSQGVGGRMATRLSQHGSFDHGAQYFTASHPAFQEQVQLWRQEGCVQAWNGIICQTSGRGFERLVAQPERFVGVPSMNAPVKSLASGLPINFRCLVHKLQRVDGAWHLQGDDQSFGGYDVVVVALPSPQARPLVSDHSLSLAEAMAAVVMTPVWAAMLAYEQRLPLEFDGCFVNQGPLSWLARNSSKPHRGEAQDLWVAHGNGDWSQKHLEESPERMGELLLDALQNLDARLSAPKDVRCHRWRYAAPKEALTQPFLWDVSAGLGVCGDWCGGPKVEGAYLSGFNLARAILQKV